MTSRVIAAVCKAKFGDPTTGPRAMDLQQMVLEELRVSASYMKCYRAKDKAIEFIRGGDDDSYSKLGEYMYCLRVANPGTITDLASEKDEQGRDRFLYAFLSFGTSIQPQVGQMQISRFFHWRSGWLIVRTMLRGHGF